MTSLPTRTVRSLEELAAAGMIDLAALPAAERARLGAVADRFAIAVTPEVIAAIRTPDARTDPIARQYLPASQELEIAPNEIADPIGDEAHSPVKGVVHRYPDRVLLKLLHTCPVYCRFCFRREMVGPGGDALNAEELAAAVAYIAARAEVHEVILTGGDPLMLAPRRLAEVLDTLEAIDHIGVVRLHSRVPVVDTVRVSPDLLSALKRDRVAVWLAVHCNHARELTPAALSALRRLADAGIPLLSQTVLLRGVNDDAAVLEELFRALVQARVKPYYLHHGDLARGTGHFRVSLAEGQNLMRALRGRVSGLCQPTYVLDIPGGHGKAPVGPCYADIGDGRSEGQAIVIEDWRGRQHTYRDG